VELEQEQESIMSEIIEKSYNVTSPARFDLSNIRGSVEVHPWEEDVIKITATKDTGSGDDKRTEILFSQEADGSVKVETRFPDATWSWVIGSFPCKVHYVVQAPRQCSLKLKGVSNETSAEGFEGDFSIRSVSGEIHLNDLNGPVKVNTVSGEVELEKINGDLNLTTVSGKITGKQVNGNLRLNTVSGKVSLDESYLPSVDATTVSGKMRYQTGFGEGPYRFNSVSGDVDLLVPPETRCSAQLHAISGKLYSKLPATSITHEDGKQVVDVQGGGVAINLHSVSGNLSLAS
jgi:DUF4097 and DUF4098 domain-containing protein YvlB